MTIELSNDEVNLLMMELGYVAAAHAQREGFIPMYLKKLTDKIMVQAGGKPYWMKEPKSNIPEVTTVPLAGRVVNPEDLK